MGFIASSALKDIRRRLEDPAALVIWFAIPILLGGLMTLAFGGREGPKPRAHVLLVDEDDSFVSRLLAGTFGGQSDAANLASVERVSREEGKARIDAGEGTALLIIPEGFGEAILAERPIALKLVKNPAQTILPRIVEEVLSVVVDGTFYAQRLIGDPYRQAVQQGVGNEGPMPDEAIAALSVGAVRLWERVSASVDPLAIRLTTRIERDEEPRPRQDIGLLFLPSVLFMALMFISQGISEDLWVEKNAGTLRRVLATPQPLSGFLLGKLLAGLTVISVIMLPGLALGTWFWGIPWQRALSALAWSVLAGLFFLLLFHAVYLFASSQRQAGVLASMVLFPMLMAGGAFFPFELMPRWMADIGRLTPNGWVLVQFKAILAGEVELGTLLATGLALGFGGVLLFLLALRRLRSHFALG